MMTGIMVNYRWHEFALLSLLDEVQNIIFRHWYWWGFGASSWPCRVMGLASIYLYSHSEQP